MSRQKQWHPVHGVVGIAVGLILFTGTLNLTFSSNHIESALVEVVRLCLSTFEGAIAHGADFGRLLVLLVATIGLAFALAELVRSLWVTRRWIKTLPLHQSGVTRRIRRLARKCGLLDGQVVVVDSPHPLAFTHGLVRPRVWLSARLLVELSIDELEAVFWHEAHHARQRDPLRLLIARLFSRALFFVPIVRDIYAVYCTRQEIAADRNAIQAMGGALPLARALRRMLSQQPGVIPTAALVGKLDVTEARLLALLNPQHSRVTLPLSHLGVSLFWSLILIALWVSPSAGHFPSLANCASEMAHSVVRLSIG